MKLRVHDQIVVSAISPEPLRPGAEIAVPDSLGKDLCSRHPKVFTAIANKAEPAAPANKAQSQRKTKAP